MVYKWYILPIGGLYATYHLSGEPETTIEMVGVGFSLREVSTLGNSAGDLFGMASSLHRSGIKWSRIESVREIFWWMVSEMEKNSGFGSLIFWMKDETVFFLRIPR